MCSVHIGIGHDHNLIVTEFGNIEIVSISFGKAASKSVDHGLDLRIGQYLVDGGLLYIEDLTADRQDSLIVTVSGSLGRTAGGISLYNKRSRRETDLSSHSWPACRWNQKSISAW